MTAEAIGAHRCDVVVEAPRAVELGQFYFVMIGKGECSDPKCGVEALAPIEWDGDFGYGDLQDALTEVLRDREADYVDGIETVILPHHPDVADEIEDALAYRPISPNDGRPLMDARFGNVSIQFSVFMLALPEMPKEKGFGFMPHNPSRRSVLSLDGYLIEALFSSELFAFRALLGSFFAEFQKCACDIDGTGAFDEFRIVMPEDVVWSFETIDLVGSGASALMETEGESLALAELVDRRAQSPLGGELADGQKRFLAIHALGYEDDPLDELGFEELSLGAFDAAAVVRTDRSVEFLKGGSSISSG